MRRVSVVGNSGSGKTRFARRLAVALGVPHIELDSIANLPGWETIERATFRREVEALTAGEGWVVDGNYRDIVIDGPVWRRADTVIWIDLPRWVVMCQVTRRTLRRVIHQEELWNGNREPFRNLYAWDPHKSIIRWSWTQHAKYRDRFSSAMESPPHDQLRFIRLRNRGEIAQLLKTLDQ